MAKRRRKAPMAKMTTSKDSYGAMKCGCHGPGWGLVLLILGILFLLQDLTIWSFWNLNWWTVLLIAFGLGALLNKH